MVTGILFQILTDGQTASNYPKFLGILATLYIVEPLVTRVYIQNACAAGEKVSLCKILYHVVLVLHRIWYILHHALERCCMASQAA